MKYEMCFTRLPLAMPMILGALRFPAFFIHPSGLFLRYSPQIEPQSDGKTNPGEAFCVHLHNKPGIFFKVAKYMQIRASSVSVRQTRHII